MDHASYSLMTEDLRVMMAERLSIRAKTFPKAVRKAGRLLPANARAAAQELIALDHRLSHPKLAARTDPTLATRAETTVRTALNRHRPGARTGYQRSLLLAEIGFRAMVVIAVGLAIFQMQSGT